MQLHLPELDLNRVEVTGGDLTVLREQAEVARSLLFLVKDLKLLAPCGFLFVVNFAKVENSSLDRLARAQPSILDDAEVAMSLAVFIPVRLTQKHRNSRMAECLGL